MIYEKYLPFVDEKEQVKRIRDWNLKRNGLKYDRELEINMFVEEYLEVSLSYSSLTQLELIQLLPS